jgi:acetate kinase
VAEILVLNTGSSTVKYRRFDMSTGTGVSGGVIEGGGDEAIRAAFEESGSDGAGELAAVGHRVVHGGDRFTAPVLVDDDVLAAIEDMIPLAPLHNPGNLAGIRAARAAYPDVPQVAVFDTAFGATMPPHAYRYALPDDITDGRVRRYGFHGTSHAFVSRRAAAHLGHPASDVNLITLHLGNGASAAAVEGGRCVDTSMGMTPLEGLVMGTRSGDVDPGVLLYLMRETGLGVDDVDTLLNKRSGLAGLAGSNDVRELTRRAGEGDEVADQALAIFCYRIRKYVGAYVAVLGRVDAIVFTGGIGEHSPAVRARVCEGLGAFGVELDGATNAAVTGGRAALTVSGEDSGIDVLVVPTNEELEIAEQALAVVLAPKV